MDNKELLQLASSEIKSLRRQNEIMSARLDMFDNMMCILYATPGRENGKGMMHPDVVFEIEKVLSEDKDKEDNKIKEKAITNLK